MNKKEIRAAIERYSARLREYGDDPRSLGWGAKGRAPLRYEILLSQWDFTGCSVLDFGCGFGDLYGYMMRKGIRDFSYYGVDINPEFIELGKKKYPSARFIRSNLLETGFRKVDFVLSSGVFNHKLSNNLRFVKRCFHLFDSISRKGFASNFLSDKVEYRYDYTFHADPAVILDLAYKYSNNIVLRNDYMPYEFTVFINKFSTVDRRATVYSEFAGLT